GPIVPAAPLRDDVRSHLEAMWRADAHDTRLIVEANDAKWLETCRAYRQWVLGLSRLTPGTLLIEVAADLADTVRLAERRLSMEIEDYQHLVVERLFDDRPRVQLRVPRDDSFMLEKFDRHDRPNVRDVPEFAAQTPTLSARVIRLQGDLLFLAAYAVAGVVGMFLSFSKRCFEAV